MMKKVLLGFLLLISATFLFVNIKNHKIEIVNSEDLAVYVNDELQANIPSKGEAIFIKSVCDNNAKATWDNDNWGLLVTNMSKKTKCNLYFSSIPVIYNFDYTGSEQVFTAPVSGTYKLETWGAQGGNGNTDYIGGYGGYSAGIIALNSNMKLYLNVGGKGEEFTGGYNGGGNRENNNYVWRGGAGGGATHIATKSGLLSTLENYKSEIIIVSGGGGGACGDLKNLAYTGGSGGGKIGTSEKSIATPGTQLSSGIDANNKITSLFGIGGIAGNEGGGGGGYFGGGSGRHDTIGYSGAGGSGYIGNLLLKDKTMYCYNCEESNDESTKTISTTCSEETPTENCAKKGNGYARITLINIDE